MVILDSILFFACSDVDIQAQLTMNQSRAEEITMREDYGSLSLSHHDEGFGDLEFNDDGPEMLRDPVASHSGNLFGESGSSFADTFQRGNKEGTGMIAVDDGFGAPLGQDMMGMFP